MRTQTFEDNGVTYTLRAETIEDALDTDMLTHQMGTMESARENYKRARFIQLVLLTTIEGDLGFEWPSADSSLDALMTAYEAWKKLPADLLRTWQVTLALANAGSNDPELSPALSEKKEATPA